MVPKAGLEPARRVTTLDFESSASANSATSAYLLVKMNMVPKAGLEPARRVTTLDFESSASANSATSAYSFFDFNNTGMRCQHVI